MRGWIALLITITLLGACAWVVFKPEILKNHSNANLIEHSEVSKPLDNVEIFLIMADDHLPPINFKNPLYTRQGYFLRRWILRCTWEKMQSDKSLWAGEINAKIVKFETSIPYQHLCADELIDKILDDGEFALAMAQGMKSVGIYLPPHYDDVPNTWPHYFSNSYASKKFVRIIGHP